MWKTTIVTCVSQTPYERVCAKHVIHSLNKPSLKQHSTRTNKKTTLKSTNEPHL